MADLIRKMQEGHTVEDLDTVIDEVYGARGSYSNLDARLDDMEGGAPTPSTSIPAMDGTGSAGAADTYARGDHTHPTDTSRHPTIDSSHKLSADLVDDASATHKFATAAQLDQISTNETNIISAYGGIVGKNLFDINNASEAGRQRITATIENGAITVTNTGNYSYVSYPLSLKAGTYRISATISDYEADEPSYCFIVVGQTSNASGTYLASIPITGNGDVSALFTINENKTVYITYCPMLSAASGTNTFIVANNMTMKNGDDTTYQPYIYSNAELTAAIQAIQAQLANQ